MIIGVDFDGTVAEHDYPDIGPPVPLAIDYLKKLVEGGARLILYTMRSGKTLHEAVKWLNDRGVPLWSVNENHEQVGWTSSPKPYCHVYVDDSAACVPLIESTKTRRPMVDWSLVGPDLINRLKLSQVRTLHKSAYVKKDDDGFWVLSDLSRGIRNMSVFDSAFMELALERASVISDEVVLEFTDGEKWHYSTYFPYEVVKLTKNHDTESYTYAKGGRTFLGGLSAYFGGRNPDTVMVCARPCVDVNCSLQ